MLTLTGTLPARQCDGSSRRSMPAKGERSTQFVNVVAPVPTTVPCTFVIVTSARSRPTPSSVAPGVTVSALSTGLLRLTPPSRGRVVSDTSRPMPRTSTKPAHGSGGVGTAQLEREGSALSRSVERLGRLALDITVLAVEQRARRVERHRVAQAIEALGAVKDANGVDGVAAGGGELVLDRGADRRVVRHRQSLAAGAVLLATPVEVGYRRRVGHGGYRRGLAARSVAGPQPDVVGSGRPARGHAEQRRREREDHHRMYATD